MGQFQILQDVPSPSVFWECAFEHRLLLAPLCWKDILPGLVVREMDWDYSLPYGIFSRRQKREETSHFMAFVKKTYCGTHPDDTVPMLSY